MFIKPVIKPPILLSTLLLFIIQFYAFRLTAQTAIANSTGDTVVIAGNYDQKESYTKKWGTHYRKEWSTPVRVKKVLLDTLEGGLSPYQRGGGRQSKTLRLHDKNKREYVLRSIDKTFGKALPEIFQGTFIETLIDDQVTIGHPYSAPVIAPLAEAAGIFHTNPEIFFIPRQPALDSFNNDFGDQLYLFEKRPDENWDIADNFGNSKNIVGTEKMLEELLEDNDHQVDQLLFIRSRLFDFFIGDWGRHEDQWRWASYENDNKKIFRPIPRDRDQAFSLFDGKWLKTAIAFGDLGHLQSFSDSIKDITTYNFTARNLDRRLTNAVPKEQWMRIAKEMQEAITDQVIESAIRQLPPEIFSLSGNEIITKLKSRRDHLLQNAISYYNFLSKDVDIPGSDKDEYFQITRLNNENTNVKIFAIRKNIDREDIPFYDRTFKTSETNEIRLYGLKDDDVFKVTGKTDQGIMIRIIGGKGKDILIDSSQVSGSKKLTRVYDTEKSRMIISSETHLEIKDDSTINRYEYESFRYDKKGFNMKPGFISLTFGYGKKINKWRKEPVGSDQSIKLKYSINRGAFYADYQNILYQSIGKWNLLFGAGAAFPNVVNFFGVGNNTVLEKYDRHYFRLRSTEFYGKIGINRILNKHHLIEFSGLYQTIKIKVDSTRFLNDYLKTVVNTAYSINPDRNHFIGANTNYRYQNTDDPVIPSKGFTFFTSATYTYNLKTPANSFTKISGEGAAYFPLTDFLSFGFRAGGATNIGDAEFYQLNQLGSHKNLRGYRKYRFYGKSIFYNNNELRFIFNARNKVFNGKYGFITFLDNGRVWHPGEISNTWHYGYGLGGFVSLFNKVILSASYGISKEDKVVSVYFGFYF